MATANTVGTAVGFLTAFVVPVNGTNMTDPTAPVVTNAQVGAALTGVYWVFFIVCAITMVVTLIYFPDKPPCPPSLSSSVTKMDVKVGMQQLLGHGRFWVVVAAMAIPLGVYSAWLNVLDVNLKVYNFSQSDAGWIGFGSALAGGLAGVVCGRLADVFPGRLTKIIATLYLVSAALMVWFTLMCAQIVSFSLTAAYLSAIAVGFFMYASWRHFFCLD
jgi:FLVCR family MFS transporter